MNRKYLAWMLIVGAAAVWNTGARAQSDVGYGTITAVKSVSADDANARAAGAVVGGVIGLASGSGQSRSNRALRALGGATAGNAVAGRGAGQVFEYTILLGGESTIVVTDESGLRVGDCVSVERGAYNNLRLVDEQKCGASVGAPAAADVQSANACLAAKEQFLAADTDDAIDRLEREIRLFCDD